MLGNDMSVADVMAIARTTNDNDGRDGYFGGNGMWVLFLFFLLAGGNGFGFNRNNNWDPCCAPATQQGMADAFNFNQLDNGVRGLERGLCDLGFAIQGMTNNLGTQIADTKFAIQQCLNKSYAA